MVSVAVGLVWSYSQLCLRSAHVELCLSSKGLVGGWVPLPQQARKSWHRLVAFMIWLCVHVIARAVLKVELQVMQHHQLHAFSPPK